MNTWIVALCYAGVVALSAWLLWRFSHIRWYWHLMSIVLAFGIGLMPMKESWNRPSFDLIVGSVFLFLLFWGAGEWAFRWFHVHRHA
jgi:hypothetical protein